MAGRQTNPQAEDPKSATTEQPATPAGTGDAHQTYDGRQITPGNTPDGALKPASDAADASAVAASNPRQATGEPPRTARPIGTPEVQVPAIGRTTSQAKGASVAAEGESADQDRLVMVHPFDKAREQFTNREGVELLLEACDRFGINPDASLPIYDGKLNKPSEAATRAFRQLLSWQFYPAGQSADGYDSVVLVTSGGVKLRYSENPKRRFDEDTENRLRQAFGAFRLDPKTKEMVAQDLPGDLALPLPALLGFPVKADHVYRRGYLAEGGRDEANRREVARAR